MTSQEVDGQQVVLAAVIRRGDLYLVCQRPAHKRHGSLWEFPGGKIEPGETLLQAAARELKEELSMRATRVGSVMFSMVDPASKFLISFVNVEADGEPMLLEHSAFEWVTCERLLDLPLAPSDRSFAEHLQAP